MESKSSHATELAKKTGNVFNRVERVMIGGLRKTSVYLLAGASALGVLVSGAPAQAQGLTEAQYQRLKAELKKELKKDDF